MTQVTFDCFLWFKKSQDPDKIHTLWLVDVFYIFLNLQFYLHSAPYNLFIEEKLCLIELLTLALADGIHGGILWHIILCSVFPMN